MKNKLFIAVLFVLSVFVGYQLSVVIRNQLKEQKENENVNLVQTKKLMQELQHTLGFYEDFSFEKSDSVADQIIILSHSNKEEIEAPALVTVPSDEELYSALGVSSLKELMHTRPSLSDELKKMASECLSAFELLEAEARYYANVIKENENEPENLSALHFHRFQFYAKTGHSKLEEFGLPMERLKVIWDQAYRHHIDKWY